MMKILLFGKYGQLGWELHRTLACLGTVNVFDYPEVDFKKPESLHAIVQNTKPEMIINAVAYTDVDKAESEPEIAKLVNSTSVGVLAEEARERNIPFIHYSTDYVFDGNKGTPYTEKDTPNPINIYGQSKLEGEQAITQVGGPYLIFRTSWVYSLRKGGFVNKVMEWAGTQKVIRIVDDQIGSPTWARMLAEATALLIAGYNNKRNPSLDGCSGIYHLAGEGFCSRYEWAKAILELNIDKENEKKIKLEPAKSEVFLTAARRPSFSGLDTNLFSQIYGFRLPAWNTALAMMMSDV